MATDTITELLIWLAYGLLVAIATGIGIVLTARSDSSARGRSWSDWFEEVRPSIAPSQENETLIFGIGFLLVAIVQVVVRSTATVNYLNDPFPVGGRSPSMILVILAFLAETGMFLLWVILFAAMRGPGSYSALITIFVTVSVAVFIAVAFFIHAFVWQGVLMSLCGAWYIYLFIINIAVVLSQSAGYSQTDMMMGEQGEECGDVDTA